MNLQPLGNRIIVKAVVADKVTASGIVLPDTNTEKPQKGTVLAIGEEVKTKGIIKVKGTVIYSKYGGTEIEHEGETYLFLRDEDILATVK